MYVYFVPICILLKYRRRKEGKRQISGIRLLPRTPPYIDLLSLDLDFSNNKIEFHNQSFLLYRSTNVKFTGMSVVRIPIESKSSYLVLTHFLKSRTDNFESGMMLWRMVTYQEDVSFELERLNDSHLNWPGFDYVSDKPISSNFYGVPKPNDHSDNCEWKIGLKIGFDNGTSQVFILHFNK